MQSEEITCWEQRAEAKLRQAQPADDLTAALAHREFAGLYFERVRQPAVGRGQEVKAFHTYIHT